MGAKGELVKAGIEQDLLMRKIFNDITFGKHFSFNELEYIPFKRKKSADDGIRKK